MTTATRPAPKATAVRVSVREGAALAVAHSVSGHFATAYKGGRYFRSDDYGHPTSYRCIRCTWRVEVAA